MVETLIGQVLSIACTEIYPNPMQPRQMFDQKALEELADSIAYHGVLQPLTVRKTELGWELIAGERRWRAAKIAGLTAVPCIESEADDQQSALHAMVENLQRRDLHYLEEASAIAALLQHTGMTQEEVAQQLGKSPSALANKLRLLRLGPNCASFLLEHQLSERHARALLSLQSDEQRLEVLHHVVEHHLNVAQTDRYIHLLLAKTQTTKPQKRRAYILKDVRLFLNSMDRNVQLMRDAGVDAHFGREDTEDAIFLTIRIPKQEGVLVETPT